MNVEYEFRLFQDKFGPYKKHFRHLEHKSSNDMVFVIKILTTHSDFKRVLDLVSQNQKTFSAPLATNVYTEKERLSAEILHLNFISGTSRGMSGDEYGTKYKIIAHCNDLALKKQSSPLRINKRNLSAKDIQETFSYETIISDRFKTILKDNKVTGYELGQIFNPTKIKETADDVNYVSDEQVKLDAWYQLIPVVTCGNAVLPTKYGIHFHNFSIEDQNRHNPLYQRTCGEYRLTTGPGIGSAFHFKRRNWPGTDIAMASELRIAEYYCPFIIITQKLYRIMKEKRVTGFKAEPAYFVD